MSPWLRYSILRVLLFAAIFALLSAVGVQWAIAAVVAAVVGLCISYIFFGDLRNEVALSIAQRRAAAGGDSEEDDALD